jgi:hypothetical protein
MPDYGEILAFLAANPPQLAKCLRSEETDEDAGDLLEDLKPLRIPQAEFN